MIVDNNLPNVEDILDFSFLKENPGDICFKNSGGSDCAIVYYAVAKYIKENNLNIRTYHVTIDTVTKFWYVEHAKKVIDFVGKELGIYPIEHSIQTNVVVLKDHETNLPIGYREVQRELVKKVIENNPSIKYHFDGGSNHLPFKYLEQAKLNNYEKYRYVQYDDKERISLEDGAEPKNRYYQIKSNGLMVYTPFMNLDKRSVKKSYDFYGVTDTLFPITRSCEQPSTNANYKGQYHCGKCLFCFERESTFGFLE